MEGVTVEGLPNEVQLTASNAFFNNCGTQAPGEVNVIDGTTVRLREVSLSYALPQKWMSKLPFKGVELSLVGQNIWFKALSFPKYMNFDTDVLSLGVGNGLGFDFLTGPSSTRYGGSIRIRF